jgi:hypothetical protein
MVRLSHGRIGTCTKTSCAQTRARRYHTRCSSRMCCQSKDFRLCSMVSRAKSSARDSLHRISTSLKHRSSVTIVSNLLGTVTTRSVSNKYHRYPIDSLTPAVDAGELGVIAPYKAQVRAIRELLKPAGLKEVSVGSVEQFQGQVRAKSGLRDTVRDGANSSMPYPRNER